MERFRLTVLVILGHLGLFGLLLLFSMMTSCQWFNPKQQETISIDLSSIPDPPDPTAEPATPQPTSAPTQSPLATPTKRATARPTPTPTPTLRTTVRATSTPRPTATPKPTSTPRNRPRPTNTPDRIATVRARITPQAPGPTRNIVIDLGQGVNTGGGSTAGRGTSGGGTSDGKSVGVHGTARLKALWSQPAGVSAASGLSVRVSITVDRNGNVSAARIIRPSRHPGMDGSVQEALNSLRYVKPLPANYSGSSYTFEVTLNAK